MIEFLKEEFGKFISQQSKQERLERKTKTKLERIEESIARREAISKESSKEMRRRYSELEDKIEEIYK